MRISKNTWIWKSHDHGREKQKHDTKNHPKHLDCSDAGNSGETSNIPMRWFHCDEDGNNDNLHTNGNSKRY